MVLSWLGIHVNMELVPYIIQWFSLWKLLSLSIASHIILRVWKFPCETQCLGYIQPIYMRIQGLTLWFRVFAVHVWSAYGFYRCSLITKGGASVQVQALSVYPHSPDSGSQVLPLKINAVRSGSHEWVRAWSARKCWGDESAWVYPTSATWLFLLFRISFSFLSQSSRFDQRWQNFISIQHDYARRGRVDSTRRWRRECDSAVIIESVEEASYEGVWPV